MLAWPIQAEQAMNARFIVDEVKAGIEVCKVTDDFVTKERIGDAVRCFVRDGASVRNNVRKLQRLAMAAMREGGSVDHNLESFVAELQVGKQVNVPTSASHSMEYFLAGDCNRALGRSNTTEGDVDGGEPRKLMRGQRNHLHEQWNEMQVLEFRSTIYMVGSVMDHGEETRLTTSEFCSLKMMP